MNMPKPVAVTATEASSSTEASTSASPQASTPIEPITPPQPTTPVDTIHILRRELTNDDNVPHTFEQEDFRAPEGGCGWIVVVACCSISFLVVDTVYSWGVMQAALLKQGLSSASTLSWIGFIAFTCIALFAVVNARLIQLFGPRYAAICGIITLGLSEIASGSLTHKAVGLFFTAGVFSGMGTRYDNSLLVSVRSLTFVIIYAGIFAVLALALVTMMRLRTSTHIIIKV